MNINRVAAKAPHYRRLIGEPLIEFRRLPFKPHGKAKVEDGQSPVEIDAHFDYPAGVLAGIDGPCQFIDACIGTTHFESSLRNLDVSQTGGAGAAS